MIVTINKTFEVPDAITDGQEGYVSYIDHMGDDLTPCRAARLSTGNETGVSVANDNRLRLRLYRDQHMSPFEMMEMILEAQTMLFVFAQFVRHRTFSYNAFSGRYAEMPYLTYIPPFEDIRIQHPTNKQMSAEAMPERQAAIARNDISDNAWWAHKRYQEMLKLGVSKETARMVLPQNQYTKFWMKGDARCWLQMFNLRLRPDVQPESRRVAEAMAEFFKALFPETYDLFTEYTLLGDRLSHRELKALASAYKIENGKDILTAILGEKDGQLLYEKFTKG